MKHVLSVLVKNQPGVLVRVASMFSRREFNIESLTACLVASPPVVHMVSGDEYIIDQVIKQLGKLPDVEVVKRLDGGSSVYRIMTLIKVQADDTNRLDVLKMAELFGARVIDVQPTTLIFEITGSEDKVKAFNRVLSSYRVLEVIQTGVTGLERGERTIQEYCEEREYYGKNLL